MNQQPRFTALGKIVSILLVAGLVTLGIYMIRGRFGGAGGAGGTAPGAEPAAESGGAPEVQEVKVEVPKLSPPAAFQFKDNIVPIEISEYAGYAGLIAANGGLEPTENSLFFKNHGFKVKLTISEDETWSELNEGKIAASVTTVDVLAAYGRQLHAVVPAQIGFSRGADGVVVRSDIKRINQLKGKTIASAQFTEVDFFIRYLAQEAGLPINPLGSLDATPHPDRLNVVYTEDGFEAGDLFLNDVKSGKNKLAGCVTWEPKVSEVVSGSGGQAHVLTTNRNLLIIADVLIVHRGFAQEQPKIVQGLVQGLLEGNRLMRDKPEQNIDVVARAFKWDRDKTTKELANVHLSNLPENLAFFSGAMDAAGSFGGIYQSAVLAYGSDVIKDPPDPSRFAELSALQAIEKSGIFKDQTVAIAPIRTTQRHVGRKRPAAQQGHPVHVRAERGQARHRQPGQRPQSRGDQAPAAGQPGIDAAPARPRRQRQGRGVPQDRRRSLRAHPGAARHGVEQEPRGRNPPAADRQATASIPSASTSSAAAGKSRRDPTRI